MLTLFHEGLHVAEPEEVELLPIILDVEVAALKSLSVDAANQDVSYRDYTTSRALSSRSRVETGVAVKTRSELEGSKLKVRRF